MAPYLPASAMQLCCSLGHSAGAASQGRQVGLGGGFGATAVIEDFDPFEFLVERRLPSLHIGVAGEDNLGFYLVTVVF